MRIQDDFGRVPKLLGSSGAVPSELQAPAQDGTKAEAVMHEFKVIFR